MPRKKENQSQETITNSNEFYTERIIANEEGFEIIERTFLKDYKFITENGEVVHPAGSIFRYKRRKKDVSN